MKAVTRFAAILMIGSLPFAALAQTTDTPAADAAEPVAPVAPGGTLATGETVAPNAEAGQEAQQQIYIREEHGDFEVRCLRTPEGQDDPCQLFQRMSDAEGNPTADINFFDLPDGSDLVGGATILTPLQTLLTSQVTMSIDGGEARRYPFAFCDQGGCYARLGFTAEDIARFRAGARGVVVVVPALAPDQPAQLTLSLSGFTAGYAAVEVANPE